MARVGAILRRAGEVEAADASILRFADLTMHIDTHEVWRQEHPIDLTATEFNLLRHLLENARRVISKSELIDNVWGYGFSGDPTSSRPTSATCARRSTPSSRRSSTPSDEWATPSGCPEKGEPAAAAGRRHVDPAGRRAAGGRHRHLRLGALVPLRAGRRHAGLLRGAGLQLRGLRHRAQEQPVCRRGRPLPARLARRVRAHHQPQGQGAHQPPVGLAHPPDPAPLCPPPSRCSGCPRSTAGTSAATPAPSAPTRTRWSWGARAIRTGSTGWWRWTCPRAPCTWRSRSTPPTTRWPRCAGRAGWPAWPSC
jgi:hypothetical protein